MPDQVSNGLLVRRRKPLLWISIFLAMLSLLGIAHGYAETLSTDQFLRNPAYLAMVGAKNADETHVNEALWAYWTVVSFVACLTMGSFVLYWRWTYVLPQSSVGPPKVSGSWRGRLRFHLSTAIAMMFVASGVVWLNTLPIWHYASEENGEEVFEIVGYGWPCRVCATGLSWGASYLPSLDWVAVGLNLLFMAFIAAYFGTFLEWRWVSPAVRRGLTFGSIYGIVASTLWFVVAYLASSLPAVTVVSLSIGFKPGWQNWRSAVVVFLLVGSMIGCARWYDRAHGRVPDPS